jgi:hypothetical protein
MFWRVDLPSSSGTEGDSYSVGSGRPSYSRSVDPELRILKNFHKMMDKVQNKEISNKPTSISMLLNMGDVHVKHISKYEHTQTYMYFCYSVYVSISCV